MVHWLKRTFHPNYSFYLRVNGYIFRSFINETLTLDFVSVHKHAKKELGQYPAILTEQAWSITRIY